jgi:hypothetical protein
MATPKRSRKTNRLRKEGRPASGEQPISSKEPARAEIERRAYEIYLARGGADGYDQDDWLQAERELKELAAANAD